MTADDWIALGSMIAAVGSVASVAVTLKGNKQVTKVDGHLHRQDEALGIGGSPHGHG